MTSTSQQLLFDIYRSARERPTVEFQQYVLARLKPLLRFGSAVWATGWIGGTAADPLLSPILPLSCTHETDPAGVAHWRTINSRDKAVPLMLKRPFATQQIHAPTLFAEPEDAPMRDYTRRFGRQCALVTGLFSHSNPLIEWSVLYRADRDDHFSAAEIELCESLMRHCSEALKINRLIAASHLSPAATEIPGDAHRSSLAATDGTLIAPCPEFARACAVEWRQFDGRTLPASLVRELDGAGHGTVIHGRHMSLHARRIGEFWWLTALPLQAGALPSARLIVARHFVNGLDYKTIAATLGIAPSTVRNQIAAAYRQLGVSSRRGLSQALRRFESGRPVDGSG